MDTANIATLKLVRQDWICSHSTSEVKTGTFHFYYRFDWYKSNRRPSKDLSERVSGGIKWWISCQRKVTLTLQSSQKDRKVKCAWYVVFHCMTLEVATLSWMFLLKIKVLHWHRWIQEEPLTSMQPFIAQKVLYSGMSLLKCSLRYKKWFF